MFASTNYSAARRYPIPGNISKPDAPDSAFVERMVFFVMLAATIYQLVLCFIHTNVFAVSGTLLGLFEFLIYSLVLAMLLTRLRLEFVAAGALIFSYLLLMALLRSALDPKGFRDLIIPLLFYTLGRSFGTIERGDRLVKLLAIVVLLFGFFELFALDLYSRFLNVFSYYATQGGSPNATNWAEGTLALNGTRPEGIGRTFLPSLLGAHRVSSVFLEPVSMGNFATIIAAWGLSKGRDEIKSILFYLACAAILIVLADSRFSGITVVLLITMRCLLRGRANAIVIAMPFLAMIALVLLTFLMNQNSGDNVTGRLFITGRVLSNFGPGEILGLSAFAKNFGDMGYANVLTKFGIILCIALWIGFWLIKMNDERGCRFRVYLCVYASLILAISGTSFFALKTAGLMWFLVGCCAAQQAIVRSRPVANPGTSLQYAA